MQSDIEAYDCTDVSAVAGAEFYADLCADGVANTANVCYADLAPTVASGDREGAHTLAAACPWSTLTIDAA